MGTESLDPDLKATLTPEELAAIDDVDPAEAQALKNLAANASDDGDGDDDAGDDDDDDGASDDAPAPAAAAPAEAAAAAPAPTAAAPDAESDSAGEPPPVVFQLPDDFDARVKANKEALAELRRRRDDGEVSTSEFDTELEKLMDERADLGRLQARADAAEDRRKEYEQRQINDAWGKTLKTASADGVDYVNDKAKHADFDTFIKALANKPENNDKPLAWFFAEAHKRVLALHGIGGKPAAPTDPKAAARAARAPDLAALPKDLSQVPGGQNAGDVSGDEFEDLDSLEGEAYEEAIAAQMRRDQGFATKFTSRVRGNTSTRVRH